MGNSSILGVDQAPTRAPGADSDALGPSDSSDSGSDLVGVPDTEAGQALPERDAPDISVDRVMGDEAQDPDLGFMEEAAAGEPRDADGEAPADAGDPTDGPLAGVRDPG